MGLKVGHLFFVFVTRKITQGLSALAPEQLYVYSILKFYVRLEMKVILLRFTAENE